MVGDCCKKGLPQGKEIAARRGCRMVGDCCKKGLPRGRRLLVLAMTGVPRYKQSLQLIELENVFGRSDI